MAISAVFIIPYLVVIILCIGTLAATIGLIYVAINKKNTSNAWVWVAPATTFLAFISCLMFGLIMGEKMEQARRNRI